jgi:hypothetical protein
MDGGAAQAWFVAGTVPLIVAGGLHALGTLVDLVRPTFFIPVDRAAQPAMEGTTVRLRGMFPRARARDRAETPTVWNAWLGFNISHGLGVFGFGLLCLLIAVHDFALVERIDAILPLAVAFSAAFLAISIRFWFYGPVLITATSTACFAVATVLSL